MLDEVQSSNMLYTEQTDMKNNYSFVTNISCEYLPCHQGIDKEEFNCLFCFCPLYHIPGCPGTPKMLLNGVKDCSSCVFPHVASNYTHILSFLRKNWSIDRGYYKPGTILWIIEFVDAVCSHSMSGIHGLGIPSSIHISLHVETCYSNPPRRNVDTGTLYRTRALIEPMSGIQRVV